MQKLVLLSILSIIFSSSLYAREDILSITDNNDNEDIYNLVVSANDQTNRIEFFYKDTYVDGKKIKREILNPQELKADDGVILEKRDKRNVLNLKSDNFDYDRGGIISIDALYNGIHNERRRIDIDLAFDKESWKVFKDNKVVSRFHVKVNKVFLIGTVGIKKIEME